MLAESLPHLPWNEFAGWLAGFVFFCTVIAILLRGKAQLLRGTVSTEELDKRLFALENQITKELENKLVSHKDLEITKQSFLLAINESAEKNRHASRIEIQAVSLKLDETRETLQSVSGRLIEMKAHLNHIKPMSV